MNALFGRGGKKMHVCNCTNKLGHIPIAFAVYAVIIKSSIEMNAAMVLTNPLPLFVYLEFD